MYKECHNDDGINDCNYVSDDPEITEDAPTRSPTSSRPQITSDLPLLQTEISYHPLLNDTDVFDLTSPRKQIEDWEMTSANMSEQIVFDSTKNKHFDDQKKTVESPVFAKFHIVTAEPTNQVTKKPAYNYNRALFDGKFQSNRLLEPLAITGSVLFVVFLVSVAGLFFLTCCQCDKKTKKMRQTGQKASKKVLRRFDVDPKLFLPAGD